MRYDNDDVVPSICVFAGLNPRLIEVTAKVG